MMKRVLVALLIAAAPAFATPLDVEQTEQQYTFQLNRAINTVPSQDVQLESLALPPLKYRLIQPKEERANSFGNSRVDLAPKAWPYPMVVSPRRPVLPGGAW